MKKHAKNLIIAAQDCTQWPFIQYTLDIFLIWLCAFETCRKHDFYVYSLLKMLPLSQIKVLENGVKVLERSWKSSGIFFSQIAGNHANISVLGFGAPYIREFYGSWNSSLWDTRIISYLAFSMSRLLMTWWCNDPRHQQVCYWHCDLGIF